MQSAVRVACILICLSCVPAAVGQIARFSFEARVTSVDAPQGHPVKGRLQVGDTISGTLQYDLALTDELDNLVSVGSYEALPAGANRFRASGGSGFVFDSSFIQRPFFVATVDDGPLYDTLLVSMSGDTSPSTLARADTRFVEMGLLLETASTAIFSSDALPQHLSLDAFELAGLDFFGTGTAFPTFLVHTTITALTTLPPALPGDYNDNGQVEQADLDLVLLDWGIAAERAALSWTGWPPAGHVDQDELDAVLLNWGAFGSSAASFAGVPEPNSFGLLAAAICNLLILRPLRHRVP